MLKKNIGIIFIVVITWMFSCNLVAAPIPDPPSKNASLNGFVRDSASDETLIGAAIYIVDLKRGVYTNKSGFYSIVDINPGTYTVKVSFMGYKPYIEKVRFDKENTLRKNFLLKQIDVKTNEVSVEAEREVEKREISISKINVPIQQIKEIRIGGEADVFRAIQMLPGVLTSSQISSGLYIRGGSPDQNLVLLDGTTVYNPTHLFGFLSTFNPDAIKDVELIKGGYPAEYGSRLSAVVNITQKDGDRNKIGGLVSLGLISSKASLEGPLFNGSWFIGGRRTYLDLVMPLINTDPNSPIPSIGFYDVNAKITQNIWKNDRIFFSGFLSKDGFDFSASGMTINMFMGNKSGSLRWTHIFGANLFTTLNLTGSYYDNGITQDMGGYYVNMTNSITDYSLKGNIEWFTSDALTFKSGFEVTDYTFNYEQNFSGDNTPVPQGANSDGKLNLLVPDWIYAAYVQGNYHLTELLSLQAGLRANYWTLAGRTTIDPRMAVRYQMHENFAVKASWGIFHQYLRLAGLENFSLFDTWLPTDNSVATSQANHYILSFETTPYNGIDLNVDFYYKDLINVSEMNMTQFRGTKVSDLFFTGKGRAYGIEVFLQKKIGRLAGWIGYTLGFVYATFDSINNGETFRPKYDRRHDVKIVLQYELSDRWDVGGSWMFQSGQSYTGATSRFQVLLPDENWGSGHSMPSQRFGLRMPDSHQMNLYISYKTKLFGLPLKLNLDIFNVYNRRDILQRSYNVNKTETSIQDVKLLPIIPTVSVEVKF